jgi:hypothetical protein
MLEPQIRITILKSFLQFSFQELLNKWHIRPSSSPCGSPVELIPKRDGYMETVLSIGLLTRSQLKTYSLTWIDELFDCLGQN